LTTLSYAKIVWRRCEINGISVWSTDWANPKYSRTRRPIATLPTTNRPWTALGMNSDLCDVRPTTACLSHQWTLFFTNWHEPLIAQWSLYVPPV
jgi:hypothetical protein